MVRKKKEYIPPKEQHKRTTIWIYEDSKKYYDELTESMGGKQYLVDAIGRMIIEGQFDYKAKSSKDIDVSKKRVSGNYILYLEVKKKAKELGYKVTDLINVLLKDNKEDILKRIQTTNEKEFKTVKHMQDIPSKIRNQRTAMWLYGDEVISNFEELVSYVGVKQYVIDTIGRMILDGEFDYKYKSDGKMSRADGNYLLFLQVKGKAHELGYSVSELFNDILKNNNIEVLKSIKQ